jgi:hypothetical protein
MLMPAPILFYSILFYSLFYSNSISHAQLLAHTMGMTSRGKPPGVSGGYSGVLSRNTPRRGSPQRVFPVPPSPVGKHRKYIWESIAYYDGNQ